MIDKDPIKGGRKYSASSPDELALVAGAKSVGLEFIHRSLSIITILLDNFLQHNYEILAEFPFDSTRKRMSLIVKNQQT